MSEIIMVKITDLFIPKGGNGKFTNDFCCNNKGDYPVYSSNNNVIFGNTNVFDYDGHYLTWSIVGCAGYITEVNGKFSITNNRGILIPTSDCKNIDFTYIKYIIEPIFRRNIKGRIGINGQNEYTTLNPAAIKKIEDKLPIPIKKDGTYDLEMQKEIARKRQNVEEKKRVLLEKIEILKKYKIQIEKDNNSNYEMIELNDLIKHNNGKSIYTKEYCQKYNGKIPLYSANNKNPISYMNTADYNGEFLTYSKNGCAGYITIISGRFSVNGDRCVITINPKYKDIDLHYLKYFLEPIFRANKKGRIGINGQNEYTKLNSTMIKALKIKVPIPILPNGSFDLEKQKEIAQKYATIESIKENIYNQIKKLINIVIS